MKMDAAVPKFLPPLDTHRCARCDAKTEQRSLVQRNDGERVMLCSRCRFREVSYGEAKPVKGWTEG